MFAQKKSIFIVLPTEYDIEVFEESLAKGIEQFTFTFHGGIDHKKTVRKLEQLMSLPHGVLILGTAPFLSIPREDFDLRVFAEIFASKINAKFILADTILSYTSIGRVELDGFAPMHPLQFRLKFDGDIEIVDKEKKFRVLEDSSIREVRDALAKKKSIFIFSLRKGLATMTICRDCGTTLSCQKCGSPLVLHSSHEGKKRMFVCNRCEEDRDSDIVCAFCRSWNLVPLGVGTDLVYEYFKENLPSTGKTKIFKLDKDSVKTATQAKNIIKDFEENPGSILVGTEMVFFYLKNKVPLSIIVSFDSLWSIPNYRMSERIIHIILSLIERTKEKLIIQTKNHEDAAIRAINSENLLSFVREELKDREKLNYPPFRRFIKITYIGNREDTLNVKRALAEVFKDYEPEIFSGFVARQKGKYVTNALIRIEPKKWSLPEISLNGTVDENLLNKLTTLPPDFQIFVDPEDLL